ncbi:MAG TPA: NUDIX domain-containing protein [Ignavibacteria bacterium]|jgi:ADP-ribose pyrophosphatase YjhB (NUDIX family)
MLKVRSSNKAVIIKDNHILAVKKKDANGFFYILPGGGQEHGETVIESLKRECLEETGYNIKIGDLLYVRDYIAVNHGVNKADMEINLHQVELMFLCEIDGDKQEPISGPDAGQIGIEWLDLNNIKNIRLYPLAMREYLNAALTQTRTIYLGDAN